MILLELLTMTTFGVMAYQDFKERAVLWMLFPGLAVLLTSLQLQYISWAQFQWFSMINLSIVSVLIMVLWGYTKYVLRQKFLNTAFGLGDILFLYAFALGFPTYPFIILLSCALLFSMVAVLIWKFFAPLKTVPLAGLMGAFVLMVMVANRLFHFPPLYVL